MTNALVDVESDSSIARKARGAFFTPEPISRFIVDWAVRSVDDRVFEPSAGDAAFLVDAVRRLKSLGAECPTVFGVEIHEHSASIGRDRVSRAGGTADLLVQDFFTLTPERNYSAVIGNPPYIRFQDFRDSGTLSRAAALASGVTLSGLASSWASFTIQSTRFLAPGGRLGLVLPAELLSVNYAAPVRQFLFDNFQKLDLVLFTHQVFPEAEADVVLLLADGYAKGPTDHATFRQSRDASTLASLGTGLKWTPDQPSAKWTGLLADRQALKGLASLFVEESFVGLETWGDTTLGMVTGNNSFFALSPSRVRQLKLPRRELLRLSPPGSAHLRGLDLTSEHLRALGSRGRSTWMFRPRAGSLSMAAKEYIEAGELAGVNLAYKCRIRKNWYEVPVVRPADLLLTAMNADTPRLSTNAGGAHHLNSVHGIYLRAEHHTIGRELLPLASLNSATLLSAELVGRSYGGGILKLEPREADVWAVPSPHLVAAKAASLRRVKDRVATLLRMGDLSDAVTIVDDIMLDDSAIDFNGRAMLQSARREMAGRRTARGNRGR